MDEERVAILKPGTVFEKYTVEKLLGRGGMGAVYLVRHNVLDSLFALKVLFPSIAVQNKQFVGRFIREAKLACKIRHPNLIAVYDAGKNPDNGMYYIVMDYVSGGSVRDLLRREHRLPPQEALRIVTQMARALVAAHEHHMVHRDIKPDNIMFDADGTARLADLGIAKSTDEKDTMLTVSSSIFGTPAYMSPEQAMDSSKVDSRADIYSLGIVFYEMLSGERPYRGDSAMQILSQVVAETEVPDIRKICPQTPPELAELISAMTAKKLAERIPDSETLLQYLNRIDVSALSARQVGAPSSAGGSEDTPAVETEPYGADNREDLSAAQAGHVQDAPANVADGAKKIAIRHCGGPELSSKTWKKIVSAEPGKDRGGPTLPLEPDSAVRPADFPHKEPSEPSAERESRGSLFKRKRTFWLACAALGAVLVLVFSWLLLDGGKSAGTPAAEEKSPAASSPARGGVGEVSSKPVPARVPGSPPATGIGSDPLSRNQIVLLAGTSDSSLALRDLLYRSFGKEKVAFRLAGSMGESRDELNSIIRSSPAAVIIGFADKYAEDRVSKAGFENIIRYHADRLRDSAVPLMCVLFSGDADGRQLRFFNDAVEEVCKLKSIPLLKYDKRPGADFPQRVKEIMAQ